jgi:hypothetical protein
MRHTQTVRCGISMSMYPSHRNSIANAELIKTRIIASMRMPKPMLNLINIGGPAIYCIVEKTIRIGIIAMEHGITSVFRGL